MSLFSSSRFAPEPPLRHGQPERTAILLCNLGTPDAPTAAALRRYLAQFLSDPRVVELPRIAWLPLLYGVILPTRPAKSAAAAPASGRQKRASCTRHRGLDPGDRRVIRPSPPVTIVTALTRQ